MGGAPGSKEGPPRFQSVTSYLRINTDEPDHRARRLIDLTGVCRPVINLMRAAGVELTVVRERSTSIIAEA